MAVVFFHLPRTGGSTVWHTSSHLAAQHGVPVTDLYHKSQVLRGSPHHPLDTLRDIKASLGGAPPAGLIHHHSFQNLTAELPPDEHHYATILRDPVDRFVSEMFHLRGLMRQDKDLRAEIIASIAPEGAEFLAALLDESAPPDKLVLIAAEQPYYQNYYLNAFWQFLFGDPAGPQDPPLMPEWVIPALAYAVRSRFCLIGRFPDMHGMVRQMMSLAGLEDTANFQLVRVANGSAIPALLPETLARLRALHRMDYLFFEEVTRGTPRPAAARWETLNADLATARGLSSALAAQMKEMRESRSWRLTRPLRAVRRRLG
jgi:hypothetical protein